MRTLNPRTHAVQWKDNCCVILDQTRLPSEEFYESVSDYRMVVNAIRRLAVRGAPAIGIAGAYAVVLAIRETMEMDTAIQTQFFTRAVTDIADARPTAVNLRWAVERMRSQLTLGEFTEAIFERALTAAKNIHEEDIASNRRMAHLGSALLIKPCEVMTYCNTGDLATGGIGTAFGVVHQAFLDGKITRVYPCETRPVMQGARLTVWELERNEIPYALICDNMAALTLRQGKVGAIFVGADRIARNGDAANKVGTYGLAVLARYHQVPFYVVAPSSSFDLSLASGAEIPIEQRHAEEILRCLGTNQPPFNVPVQNPSFDVTPYELISGIICEHGVFREPYHFRFDRQG